MLLQHLNCYGFIAICEYTIIHTCKVFLALAFPNSSQLSYACISLIHFIINAIVHIIFYLYFLVLFFFEIILLFEKKLSPSFSYHSFTCLLCLFVFFYLFMSLTLQRRGRIHCVDATLYKTSHRRQQAKLNTDMDTQIFHRIRKQWKRFQHQGKITTIAKTNSREKYKNIILHSMNGEKLQKMWGGTNSIF